MAALNMAYGVRREGGRGSWRFVAWSANQSKQG
jgi:hypothetical protein